MMFGSVQITVVEPGTIVGKDALGNDMVVTDQAAVFNGPRAWVTQSVYEKLKASTLKGDQE